MEQKPDLLIRMIARLSADEKSKFSKLLFKQADREESNYTRLFELYIRMDGFSTKVVKKSEREIIPSAQTLAVCRTQLKERLYDFILENCPPSSSRKMRKDFMRVEAILRKGFSAEAMEEFSQIKKHAIEQQMHTLRMDVISAQIQLLHITPTPQISAELEKLTCEADVWLQETTDRWKVFKLYSQVMGFILATNVIRTSDELLYFEKLNTDPLLEDLFVKPFPSSGQFNSAQMYLAYLRTDYAAAFGIVRKFWNDNVTQWLQEPDIHMNAISVNMCNMLVMVRLSKNINDFEYVINESITLKPKMFSDIVYETHLLIYECLFQLVKFSKVADEKMKELIELEGKINQWGVPGAIVDIRLTLFEIYYKTNNLQKAKEYVNHIINLDINKTVFREKDFLFRLVFLLLLYEETFIQYNTKRNLLALQKRAETYKDFLQYKKGNGYRVELEWMMCNFILKACKIELAVGHKEILLNTLIQVDDFYSSGELYPKQLLQYFDCREWLSKIIRSIDRTNNSPSL